jgi:DNA-binding transcriptional MerR regulator
MDRSWTILELAELAAEALGAAGSDGSSSWLQGGAEPRANGRVRDLPNERLIRWYVTVGLVDPPLSRRGRIAQYGQRHLLQLVAVKRRQAEGRSLAEIQAELAGATDQALAAVARMTGTEPVELSGHGAAMPGPGRFWARHPGSAQPKPMPAAATSSPVRPGAADRPGLLRGIGLAPGVTLLLEHADREPGPDDVAAILDAARPLLTELARRDLRSPGPDLLSGQ